MDKLWLVTVFHAIGGFKQAYIIACKREPTVTEAAAAFSISRYDDDGFPHLLINVERAIPRTLNEGDFDAETER